jgi:hypothetical protein
MAQSPTLPTCNALWIGGDLGPISAACLASFARQGHRTVLYSYDTPGDVPPSIELADAASILPRERIVRHKKTGSVSLFSDLFRYELLRRDLGLWIDCDVYCVRPVALSGYVFGWEQEGGLNGAVLGLPANEPALERLIALFDATSPVPPWLPKKARDEFMARKAAGDEFTLADLPWGAAGPAALTHVLYEAGLTRHAQPRSVFYPLTARDLGFLLQDGVDPYPYITPQTLTVHLWNEMLHRYLHWLRPGSALDHLVKTGWLFDEMRLSGS